MFAVLLHFMVTLVAQIIPHWYTSTQDLEATFLLFFFISDSIIWQKIWPSNIDAKSLLDKKSVSLQWLFKENLKIFVGIILLRHVPQFIQFMESWWKLDEGSVTDRQKTVQPQSTQTEENFVFLEDLVAQSQDKSIWQTTLKFTISWSSIQRMLWKDVKLYPYKLQFVHKLEEQDYDHKVQKCVKNC